MDAPHAVFERRVTSISADRLQRINLTARSRGASLSGSQTVQTKVVRNPIRILGCSGNAGCQAIKKCQEFQYYLKNVNQQLQRLG